MSVTATVDEATNASPIVIRLFSDDIIFETGSTVTISGVTTNTSANGTWTINRLDSFHYELVGSSGNGYFLAPPTGLLTLVSAPSATNKGSKPMFLGFVEIDDVLSFSHLAKTSADVPTDSTTTPVYRIYGPTGLMANGTGSLTTKDTGTVTGATNASPIAITSASHGLQTGMRVTISGVLGNTAANGTFTITRTDANTFTLDGSVGNGAYTSGGTWTVTGLYAFTYTPTIANGFVAGGWYDILITATVSGNSVAERYRFGVI